MSKSEATLLTGSHASTRRKRRTFKQFMKLVWDFRLSYLFITPFMICFTIFITLPVAAAFLLSFTYFNSLEFPRFTGWDNFRYMLSQDVLLIKYALPNTFKFAMWVGPGGYIAAFLLAWLIAILPATYRKWFALAIYTPSLAGGIAITIIWMPVFTSDRIGYLNSFLLNLGFINEPILWVTSPEYLMNVMIFVTLWSSMGIGFLAMLAGIMNVNPELIEAGRLDGIKSRIEEIWYLIIPSTKPQMLFGAIMAIVGAFKAGGLGTQLSGQSPTPQYSGHLMVNHISDYGFSRLELGYSTALSVFLLLMMWIANKFCFQLFGSKEDE